MNSRPLLLVTTVLTGLQIAAASDDMQLISLLAQPDSSLVAHSAFDHSLTKLRILSDGETLRSVPFELHPGVPLDLTWRLPRVTTCDELVMTADVRGLSAKQLPRVEVLVSTLSAQSGFQSVRSFVLKSSSQPQTLKLPASAAQWVIVRLTTPAETAKLTVAELDVRGYARPPQSRYAFKEAPATVFSVLSEIQNSVRITITENEASLFADAADGQLDEWSFAEAALLSSGVTDNAKRQKFLQQLDQISEAGEIAVRSSQTPYEKSEQLLKWLHDNTMAAGYEENQTDLATVLSDGKFNCVSSATLYNIIGRRMGLDLRAIEVPDHAFSILYVGSHHADIETTNALGFNPGRDPRVVERLQQQTGFHYIPDRHADKRREITQTGLLALTCYNHGVFHTRENNYGQALVDYFRALSLDPEFASAIQNVISVIATWSKTLSDDGAFEQAVTVVGTGLRLAPDDRTLLHNRKVIWQQWALAEIENSRDTALSILLKAAREVPDGGFDQMQAFVFIKPGERLVDNQQWNEALSLAASGLETVNDTAQVELRHWQKSVFSRWSDAALKKNSFSEAADVLEQAMQTYPMDRQFQRNTAYVVQEWLRKTDKTAGLDGAEKILQHLASRFEPIEPVQQVIESFVIRTVQTFTENDNGDTALAFLDRQVNQLQPHVNRELRRTVFDQQAQSLIEMKEWKQAVEVYVQGLKILPNDSHIRNNLLATWDAWGGMHRKAGDWSEAAEVYARALDSGIANNTFARTLGYCVQELALSTLKSEGADAAELQIAAWQKRRPKVRGIFKASVVYVQTVTHRHQKDGQYTRALLAVDRCRQLVEKSAHQRLVRIVCDEWARTCEEKKEWKQAVAVYARGLKLLPKDGHLTRNANATWNQWASMYMDDKKWDQAIRIYEQALKEFPDNRTLKNNLKYCQQQAAK